ncbi:hypothetical protein HGM15179_019082 [Zosterops borbonicus]|uniref:Set2 Rpb1 interacting domain-containing protein n=1 Tax=Zosterops borbonicus TaxID=364589 RepID=A0A8K1DAC4_9PASS|nr:hypothetical protein HGM15179_019082 [Zosterops borbonicus]
MTRSLGRFGNKEGSVRFRNEEGFGKFGNEEGVGNEEGFWEGFGNEEGFGKFGNEEGFGNDGEFGKSSKKPKTAEADTSSELAKKSKEVFRKEMSQFIVQCLNPYRKPDCKVGRITTTEDFKHLARKTRFVEEPEDQTVVAGQRIVLSCVVLNYSGIVQWTKDGLALGMGQGLKAWPRYRIVDRVTLRCP